MQHFYLDDLTTSLLQFSQMGNMPSTRVRSSILRTTLLSPFPSPSLFISVDLADCMLNLWLSMSSRTTQTPFHVIWWARQPILKKKRCHPKHTQPSPLNHFYSHTPALALVAWTSQAFLLSVHSPYHSFPHGTGSVTHTRQRVGRGVRMWLPAGTFKCESVCVRVRACWQRYTWKACTHTLR